MGDEHRLPGQGLVHTVVPAVREEQVADVGLQMRRLVPVKVKIGSKVQAEMN